MQWNLIRLRKESNLSQRQMAELLNISENSYGMKERGNKQFTSDEMFSLSKYFGKPLDQIFLPRDFGNTEFLLQEGEMV